MSVEDWIGRETRAEDLLTPRLIAEFRATLGEFAVAGLPGLQWALAPEIHPYADLGRDCHPRLGLVVPDLGLPRRMWAGGEVEWHRDLAQGDVVVRESLVSDITYKEGRSGRLGFVTLNHRYTVAGVLCLSERHDIVYRGDPDPKAKVAPPPEAEPWPMAVRRAVAPTPTMLFRYSAMTFNGHRIHYDDPYAREVEGYDGLVVHGPMQATWMHALASEVLGRVPARFAYRGVSPMTLAPGAELLASVEARETAPGELELRVRDTGRNVVTMRATASVG